MARSTAPEWWRLFSWKYTSKSTPNSWSVFLISANISSTPTDRKTSCASSSGSVRVSGCVASTCWAMSTMYWPA